MATKAELQAYIAQAFPDNSSGQITEAVMRTTLNEVTNWVTDYNPAWNYLGTWAARTYQLNDVVQYNGGSYRCKVTSTTALPTDTTKWEQVAAKGDSGDQVVNLGDSLIQNGAFEQGTTEKWNTGITIENEILNGMRVGSFVSPIRNQTLIHVRKDRLYRATYFAKVENVGNVGISLKLFDKDGNNTLKTATQDAVNYSTYVTVTTWTKKEVFFGGVVNQNDNTTFFVDATAKVCITTNIYNNTGGKGYISNLSLVEVRLSEYVPSNLAWLPDGQAVYDVNNPKRRGVYLNSTDGTLWFSQREITYHPNGTSVVFNLKRPYKFSWSVVVNDGVTIVSSTHGQNTAVSANTDSFLTLTGTAGKTVTIAIQETI